ncbi:MAG: hypothetical protein PVI51_02915 [candidate division WOR-3 bacterium]|jgi:hypothetical protein
MKKTEVEGLINITGRVRGAVFETDAAFIKNRYGAEGLEKIKTALQTMGQPIDYESVNSMEWLPLGLRALSLLVIKDAFNWNDEQIKEMGDAAPKYSFIVKLLMKFFVSPRVAFSHAPEYWVKHYDIGKLDAVELDEERRRATIQLHDFRVHPVYCKYLEGYFQRLFKFMYPKSRVEIKETKCMCDHGTHHEFLVTWRDGF